MCEIQFFFSFLLQISFPCKNNLTWNKEIVHTEKYHLVTVNAQSSLTSRWREIKSCHFSSRLLAKKQSPFGPWRLSSKCNSPTPNKLHTNRLIQTSRLNYSGCQAAIQLQEVELCHRSASLKNKWHRNSNPHLRGVKRVNSVLSWGRATRSKNTRSCERALICMSRRLVWPMLVA